MPGSRAFAIAGGALCFALAACDSGSPTADAGGAEIAIAVAPLSLPGITNADYTITVTNAAGGNGETVWSRTALDSDSYGDGAGSLSIVGPCDASTGTNSVTLRLDALYEGAGVPVSPSTYQNPTPITRDVACLPNADASVTFDMTIARAAQQGFFDVAVSFQDVFCSAKLDCLRAGTTDDLELLHNPATGGRDLTAVLAFACTGSPSGAGTWLYMNDPVITCDGPSGGEVTFDVSGLGNVDLAAPSTDNPGGYLFAASVQRGGEGLASKAYWNISFGLDDQAFPTVGLCTLDLSATAASTAFPLVPGGFALPEGRVYPVIDWHVPLTNAGGRVCGAHALNAGDEVATHYLGRDATPVYLEHRYNGLTGEMESVDVAPLLSPAAPTVSGTPVPGAVPYAGTVALSDFNQPVVASVATAAGYPIGLPRLSTDGVNWSTSLTVNPGDALYLRFADAYLTKASFVAELTVGDTRTTFSATTGPLSHVTVDLDADPDLDLSAGSYATPLVSVTRTTACSVGYHDPAAHGWRLALNATSTCGAGRIDVALRLRAIGDFDATYTYHGFSMPTLVALDPVQWRRNALNFWVQTGPVNPYVFVLIEAEAASWTDILTPPPLVNRLWDSPDPDRFTTAPSAPATCIGTMASPCVGTVSRRGDTLSYYVNGVLYGSGPYPGDWVGRWGLQMANTNSRDNLSLVATQVTMTALGGGWLELDHADAKYTSDQDTPY